MKRYTLTKRQGWFVTVFAIILYSAIGVLGKLTFHAGLTPLQSLKERFLLGSILFLLPALAVRDKTRAPLRRRDLLAAILFTGIPFALATLFYFRALALLPVPTTMFIFFNYPVVAAVLAHLLFKEPLGRRFFVSALLAVCGLAILLTGTRRAALVPAGVAAAGIGALVFAFYTVASQRLTRSIDPARISVCCSIVPAILFCIATPHQPLVYHQILARPLLLLTFVLLGACSSFGTLLMTYGIRTIGARCVSAADALEPFIGALLAAIFLHEQLSPATAIGGIFVLSALWISSIQNTPTHNTAGKRSPGKLLQSPH